MISAIVAFPLFWLVGTGTPAGVVVAIIAGDIAVSISYAACGQLLSEMFAGPVRYSGVGLSYNISVTISGFAPLAGTALLAAFGQSLWALAAMLLVISLITLVASVAAHRLRLDEMAGERV